MSFNLVMIKPCTVKSSLVSGSYIERLDRAKALNRSFFKLVSSRATADSLSYKDCKEIFHTLLPKDTKIHVNKLGKKEQNAGTAGAMYFNKNYNKYSYILELPIVKKNNARTNEKDLYICLSDFHVLAHENFHLFSTILNPKHAARDKFSNKDYMIYRKLFYKKMDVFFDFVEKFLWRLKVNEALKEKTKTEKIDFLQNCRYRLIEEDLAYKEEQKFIKHKDVEYYFFEDKIKIIERMIHKLIKQKRKALAEKNNKNM